MSVPLMPAVVLGIETPIGLAIIRDLGVRGVAVVGLASGPHSIGLASRFLSQGIIRARGAESLLAQLETLRNTLGEACLFAISESDIEMLNRHRTRLAGYRFMFADATRMERVLNKEQTCTAAKSVGIRVPRTEKIGSLADARVLSATLYYPVVLKWNNPNDVVKILSNAGLALDKARYCHSADELLTYLTPYANVGLFPLIQEYCSGYGLAQIILMHGGQPVYRFQHQRLHEWPPEGGFSTLCTSLGTGHHVALMDKSIALLQALDWEGIAMVEYRHDPVNGVSAFMEINGRFWGSLPLACQAGASFPWFCYQLLGLKQAIVEGVYVVGVRSRFMIPETKRLIRLLFESHAITDRRLTFDRSRELASYLCEFFRARSYYFVFAWRDPLPMFSDLFHSAANLLPAWTKRDLGRKG